MLFIFVLLLLNYIININEWLAHFTLQYYSIFCFIWQIYDKFLHIFLEGQFNITNTKYNISPQYSD